MTPRTVRAMRRLPDGSMTEWKEVQVPTEAEMYTGKYYEAIIEALNILGCWHSPLSHLKKDSEPYLALLGEDYEWREAYAILYGALGIEFDSANPQSAWNEYVRLREALWESYKE